MNLFFLILYAAFTIFNLYFYSVKITTYEDVTLIQWIKPAILRLKM